jgi:hypothetical protein
VGIRRLEHVECLAPKATQRPHSNRAGLIGGLMYPGFSESALDFYVPLPMGGCVRTFSNSAGVSIRAECVVGVGCERSPGTRSMSSRARTRVFHRRRLRS